MCTGVMGSQFAIHNSLGRNNWSGLLHAAAGKHNSPTRARHGLDQQACVSIYGAMCAAVMGSQVTSGFFSGLKEAGANLLPNIWGKDGSPANSSASKESDHGIGDMGSREQAIHLMRILSAGSACKE